jgi:cyclophilin family peptidyl-prolyl cis-trans isomerase
VGQAQVQGSVIASDFPAPTETKGPQAQVARETSAVRQDHHRHTVCMARLYSGCINDPC